MPARIIGMLGVSRPKTTSTLLVIEGALDPGFVVEFARAHEAAGFDMALVGYSSSSAEGFLIAEHAAARTERIGYLVAHRPGFVAPTLFARKVATFDHLTGGRIALHIITGKTDAEQCGDGYLREIRRKKGGIVLMHDIRQRSVWMVNHVLPKLVAEGYRFVTLDEVPALDQYRTPAPEEVPVAEYDGGTFAAPMR